MSQAVESRTVVDPDRSRDYRLVPAAIAAWVGALLGLASDPRASLVLAALQVIAIGAFACGRRFRRGLAAGTVAAIAVSAGIGYGVASLAAAQFREDPVVVASAAGSQVRARLAVISEPVTRKDPWGGQSTTAETRARMVLRGGRWLPSGATVQLRVPPGISLAPGDVIVAFGSVDRRFGFRPPSAGLLRARTVTVERHAGGWRAATNELRVRLARATEGLPAHARGLIAGMAVGDDRLLDPALKEAMLSTSLLHLTAVSGSHIVIIMGVIALIVPGRGPWRMVVTAVFLVGLIAVVGPEPSVLRAVCSAAVVGWGLLLKRASEPQSVLAIVVMGTVLVHPWAALDFGFCLSVLATWGIISNGRSWVGFVRDRWFAAEDSRGFAGILRGIVDAILVSLSAQLWVLPVSLALNPWVPLWGVPANVLAAPAVAPITILGLAAAMVSSIAPRVAHWLCLAAVPETQWIQSVAVSFAALPGARLPWFPGVVGMVFAAGLVGLVNVVIVFARRPETGRGSSDGNGRHRVRDRPFHRRVGPSDDGQGLGDGPVRSHRSADPQPGTRAGPRHRAD